MEQINFYKLFYWVTVADNVKTFLIVFTVIFTFISLIATACYLVNTDEPKSQATSRKWMFWAYPFMVFFWAAFIFAPSKRDALIIIAGGAVGNFITRDSSAKAIPSEVMMLLRTKIKEEINETTIKEALSGETDTLKNKTREQLEEIIKNKK